MTDRYRPRTPGRYRSVKLPGGNSAEALIDAVAGSMDRPEALLLGRYDTTGRLRLVDRTVR
ncbi:hypothetical protein AB0P41_23090 [Streptomyces sp. NPDC079167]|uniref:hypothetical protein n=1 Tax=Streptomyces sp. NPDC079167 TaxID=3154513 RepID=UPI003440509A